jgi:hypothetical protein
MSPLDQDETCDNCGRDASDCQCYDHDDSTPPVEQAGAREPSPIQQRVHIAWAAVRDKVVSRLKVPSQLIDEMDAAVVGNTCAYLSAPEQARPAGDDGVYQTCLSVSRACYTWGCQRLAGSAAQAPAKCSICGGPYLACECCTTAPPAAQAASTEQINDAGGRIVQRAEGQASPEAGPASPISDDALPSAELLALCADPGWAAARIVDFRARCAALEAALRDEAIKRAPNISGRTEPAMVCNLCRGRWIPDDPERHADNCLAAPRG